MWAKFSSALKQRPGTPSPGEQDDERSHADVLSEVFEQHPNLSVFHQPSEVPFPSPSPPASPSLTGRKSIFKRPKPRIDTNTEPFTSSPIMSPLNLPKKVKSSLQTLSNVSELSLNRPSLDSGVPPTQDSIKPGTPLTDKFSSLRSLMRPAINSTHTHRPSQDSTTTPTVSENSVAFGPSPNPTQRASHSSTASNSSVSSANSGLPQGATQLPMELEAAHAHHPLQESIAPQDKPPITPTADMKYGSLRSILRDRNTPATGQSVRFFSRDAYKVISPEISATSGSEPEEMSFAARLQRAKVHTRPAAQELFSSPTTPSLMTQMPPPNVSNIFDLSTDAELPTIPAGSEPPLLDSAVEISDVDVDPTVDAQNREDSERPPTPPAKNVSHLQHDRSHSFSFGQTVFRSLSGETAAGSISKSNRSRALSDTVFHSLLQPPHAIAQGKIKPEADINDESGAVVVYASPEQKEKDPFGANATTYYTPGTMLPPTPPNPPKEKHGRTASREEDLIWSLRTQLALQSELCVQFEVDLGARDELVHVLTSRLEETERECERRKGVVKSWRKRVADLERCVRGLQDEVERSREESMERSVMDEASGEALRMLHRRIEALERERAEGEKRESEVRGALTASELELKVATEELARRDESERELKAGIKAAKEEMEQMGDISLTHEAIARQIQMSEDSERQRAATWDSERQKLLGVNEELCSENASLQSQLTDLREEIVRKNSEIGVLNAEVEAQWRHTESAGEKMQQVGRERDELRAEVLALNERISGMEIEWSQGENRKAELENEVQEVWAAKEELERQQHELVDQLHSEQEHSDQLTQALQEREDRVIALEQESQYAGERAARFEAQLKQRDIEVADIHERAAAREKETEEAQEEVSRMKREHARIVNEQSRTLQDVVAREVEARAGLESLVREKAEVDVQLGTTKERISALQEEIERLRRQVHTLQQESADKEVKLVNLAKQRAQDKDDIQGLNIALDSKQQELELLKRRMSVRGTAGSTPAAASKVPHHRRESSIFGTPSVGGSRPSSALSDAGSITKDRKLNETPSTVTKATLARSARANGQGASAIAPKRSLEGGMGPPPAIARKNSASGNSNTATPTRIPSSSTPRASIASGAPSAYTKSTSTAAQRRSSTSSTQEPSRLRATLISRESLTSASETDEKEKENTAPSMKARRMSVVAA